MRTFTKEELAEIIESHGKWLHGNDGGERADLSYSNLSGSNLSYSNLSGSNLSYSNLSGSNLSYSNLSYSDLSGSNLRGSNLRYSIGNCENIKSMQCDMWLVSYTETTLNIGCQTHLISEWFSFSDDEIARMDSQALKWWAIWKPILQKIIEVSPAVPTGYVEKAE